MAKGIDFAWHDQLDYAGVKADGYEFVCRYLSHDDSKNLHADEAAAWHAHGMDIVLIWESTATRAEDGYTAGVSDARAAEQMATSVGAPADVVIFFAVDEDTAVGPLIEGYFRGVRDALGISRVGIYGSYVVVSRLYDYALVTHSWQTSAWSLGRWDSRAVIRQVMENVMVRGISCDVNTSPLPVPGGWSPAKPEPHRPVPVPAPVPVQGERMIVQFSDGPAVYEVVGSRLFHITRDAWFARGMRNAEVHHLPATHPLHALPKES